MLYAVSSARWMFVALASFLKHLVVWFRPRQLQ
jgi:hypothetical protein